MKTHEHVGRFGPVYNFRLLKDTSAVSETLRLVSGPNLHTCKCHPYVTETPSGHQRGTELVRSLFEKPFFHFFCPINRALFPIRENRTLLRQYWNWCERSHPIGFLTRFNLVWKNTRLQANKILAFAVEGLAQASGTISRWFHKTPKGDFVNN